MKNKYPHRVPDSYFENFEEQLFSRLNAQQFPSKSGFRIPENYLADFEVNTNNLSPTKSKSKVFYFRRYRSAIGAVAAILVAGFVIFNFNNNEELSYSEAPAIQSYIDEGNLKMDLFELAHFIEKNNIDLSDFEAVTIDDSELENYLIEESNEHLWTSALAGE